MAGQLNLKREVFALMAWHLHHGDPTPLETLYRLVRKASGEDIRAANLRFREQEFLLCDLKAMRSQTHGGADPAREDVPLLLFQGARRYHLIDGQNRINLWDQQGKAGPHRCLVVSRKGRKHVV